MGLAKPDFGFAFKLDKLSVHQLRELYDVTILKLRNCADMEPSFGPDEANADKKETDLLDFEYSLLTQAAHIKIQSKEDMLGLMELWEKASGVNTDLEPESDQALSNRIAMNIFRNMADACFTKD